MSWMAKFFFITVLSLVYLPLLQANTLIKNATILTLAESSDKPFTGYLLMDKGLITAIAEGDYEGIDAEGKIIIPTVDQYGGKYHIRGGEILLTDSDWQPERIVMIAFESSHSALAWVNAPELEAMHAMRKHYAESKMIVIEGCYDS